MIGRPVFAAGMAAALLWIGARSAAAQDAGAAPLAVPGSGVAAAPGSDPAAEPPPPEPTGAAPTFKLTCAPQPVRIAETLTCTLVIDHRPEVSVTVSAPAEVTREKPGPAEPLPDGNLRSTRTLTLTPRGLKPVRVEGLTVTWQEANGYTAVQQVEPQRVPVKSLVAGVEGADFRTFSNPGGEPGPFFDRHGALPYSVRNWPLIIGLGALAALLVGFGVGYLVRRWLAGRARDEGPYVDPRPAHIIAYERLERLVSEDLPGQGEAKTFYFRLSEIVRDYLGRRYGFDGLEMTTQEVVNALGRLGDAAPRGEAFLAVRDFLDETDLVKFADFAPADGGDTVLRIARGVIELTRVRDEVAAAGPAPGPSAPGGGAA